MNDYKLRQEFVFSIYPQEVDGAKRLRMTSLCNYILNTAGYAAQENGFGSLEMIERGMTWVLSRLAIEMIELPEQYEDIIIETWVEEYGRIVTSRHFKILDKTRRVLGYASSLWAMMNLTTRRPINLQAMPEYNRFATGVANEIAPAGKIKSVGGEPRKTHTVRYSDVDFNGHANSVKYLEWMLDSIDADKLYTRSIKRLELNYVHEAMLGDDIDIYSDEASDSYTFLLKKGDQEICKGKIYGI